MREYDSSVVVVVLVVVVDAMLVHVRSFPDDRDE